MSLTRTGHGPLDWRDDGPSAASRRSSPRNAEPIGYMSPILQHGANFENRHRVKPAQAFSIHPKNRIRPACGAMMPRAGEPCARMPGHLDCHRSRTVMDTDKATRSTAKWTAR